MFDSTKIALELEELLKQTTDAESLVIAARPSVATMLTSVLGARDLANFYLLNASGSMNNLSTIKQKLSMLQGELKGKTTDYDAKIYSIAKKVDTLMTELYEGVESYSSTMLPPDAKDEEKKCVTVLYYWLSLYNYSSITSKITETVFQELAKISSMLLKNDKNALYITALGRPYLDKTSRSLLVTHLLLDKAFQTKLRAEDSQLVGLLRDQHNEWEYHAVLNYSRDKKISVHTAYALVWGLNPAQTKLLDSCESSNQTSLAELLKLRYSPTPESAKSRPGRPCFTDQHLEAFSKFIYSYKHVEVDPKLQKTWNEMLLRFDYSIRQKDGAAAVAAAAADVIVEVGQAYEQKPKKQLTETVGQLVSGSSTSQMMGTLSQHTAPATILPPRINTQPIQPSQPINDQSSTSELNSVAKNSQGDEVLQRKILQCKNTLVSTISTLAQLASSAEVLVLIFNHQQCIYSAIPPVFNNQHVEMEQLFSHPDLDLKKLLKNVASIPSNIPFVRFLITNPKITVDQLQYLASRPTTSIQDQQVISNIISQKLSADTTAPQIRPL